jgi:RNA polymerase sigma-70 factor, ECF subfamily
MERCERVGRSHPHWRQISMNNESNTNEFLALYANGQRRIYAYIRTQVLSPTDADDVFQDTVAVLWRKFAEYQPGTDFVRWACRVARLEVLAHHRHRKRLLSIFSEEVVDAVAEKVLDISDTTIARAEALNDCVQHLSACDHELLGLRYQAAQSVKQIADSVHRTESTVYKSLQRIHDELFDCVEKKLATKNKP